MRLSKSSLSYGFHTLKSGNWSLPVGSNSSEGSTKFHFLSEPNTLLHPFLSEGLNPDLLGALSYQSMNLFIPDVNLGKLNSAHFYGWKKGLKTGMYYLRTQSKATALKGLGVDLSQNKKNDDQIACSIDNPEECEACGS